MRVISVVKTAVIAALYAALVILLAPISFYAFQVRVADALLLLPFLDYFGIPGVIGLTLGCALGNIVSPFGIIDIVFGSLANLLAGLVAWIIGRISKSIIALITAALLEAIIVSTIVGTMLYMFTGLGFIEGFIGVFIGSIISICVMGVALVMFLQRGMRLH